VPGWNADYVVSWRGYDLRWVAELLTILALRGVDSERRIIYRNLNRNQYCGDWSTDGVPTCANGCWQECCVTIQNVLNSSEMYNYSIAIGWRCTRLSFVSSIFRDGGALGVNNAS
jgi:hypothetical protein